MADLLTKPELAEMVAKLTRVLEVLPSDAKYCPTCETIYRGTDRLGSCYCDYDSPMIGPD